MAKTVIGKLMREQRKRDVNDPVVLYVGGTTDRPLRFCYGCGPRHANRVAPVRLSDFIAEGMVNGPCDKCGESLLRPQGKG